MRKNNLQDLMNQFTAALTQCVADHNFQNLFDFTTLFIKRVSEISGESMADKDFFESMGHAFLTQKEFEKAYVLLRTGAQYCNSRVAQFNLGNMFISGDGVQNNLAAAYYWFFKASQNTVENGTLMCDRILTHIAEEGNPISNILYGGKDTALPGLRRAMNVGMFLDSLTAMCERGNEMLPQDKQMAEYLKERKPYLMEKYK